MLIANIIFPIFAIAGLGYLFAYLGLFQQKHVQGLSQYVFYLAIPVLLIQTLSQITLPDVINWPFFASYYLALCVIYLIGFLIQRFVFGGSRKESAIFGMGSSYSNLVLIGIPVISAGFGDAGLVPHFLIISIHSVVQFTITTILAESDSGESKSTVDFLKLSAEKLIKDPLILALITGLSLNWLAIEIPELILSTFSLIRGSVLPAALFMLGASLAGFRISGQLSQAVVIIGLKQIMQPLLVYLLVFQLFELPQLWGAVAVIASAMPIGVNVAVFANKYDSAVAPIGTAVLLSTLMSIGTISVLLNTFI